ncbi:MAG TPA: AarF/UbiB family protein, partial [Candidatus Dormibacteraeota bacterium]
MTVRKMGIALTPQNLRRYRDIAWLLFKYGRADLVQTAGLSDALTDMRPVPESAPDPDELPSDLERLGPTFIKLGQLLSTRPDLLPTDYLKALQRLQDRIQPFPYFEVEELFQQELGVRISKAFQEFDEQPVAAASLAQVHRAVMRDGRVVAVKVQRPDIRKRVAEDLDALEDIAGFLDDHSEVARRFQFRAMFEEFRRSLIRELDFRNEARNMKAIGANLAGFDR